MQYSHKYSELEHVVDQSIEKAIANISSNMSLTLFVTFISNLFDTVRGSFSIK